MTGFEDRLSVSTPLIAAMSDFVRNWQASKTEPKMGRRNQFLGASSSGSVGAIRHWLCIVRVLHSPLVHSRSQHARTSQSRTTSCSAAEPPTSISKGPTITKRPGRLTRTGRSRMGQMYAIGTHPTDAIGHSADAGVDRKAIYRTDECNIACQNH